MPTWKVESNENINGIQIRVKARSGGRSNNGPHEYLVEAINDGQVIHSERYSWNQWIGHCHGYLLKQKVAEKAEAMLNAAAPGQTEESKEDLIRRLKREVAEGVEANSAGEALEFRRDQYGLTRDEFCEILSIGVDHYSEIIDGKRPTPMTLVRKANAIGVPLSSLVHGSVPGSEGLSADRAKELISAIRSINRSPFHEVRDDSDDDDEPRYWQRKEWIDWLLQLAADAETEL